MSSEGWKTWVVLSSLASATCLAVACTGSNSSSGGHEDGFDASADVGTPYASTSDAPTSDTPMSNEPDADTCLGGIPPGIGPLNLTFDQELAYLCSESEAGVVEISAGTMECDGLIALAEHHGVDGMYFFLFDPTTRDLVEALACNDCDSFGSGGWCVTSATGIDLTKSPAFNACWGGGLFGGGGGFGFQAACLDGGPTGPPDSGPPDASSDAASDASSE